MGLFDFLKKKKNTNLNNVDPLNIDSLISWYKSQKPNATEKDIANFFAKIAEPEKDLEHLTPEGELPWGWFNQNKSFTNKIQNEYSYFLDNWINSRGKDVRTEYGALKSLVLYIKDAKTLCETKGECFSKWFSDCIADREYLEIRQADLKYIEEHYDELLKQEQVKRNIEQNLLPHLRTDLLNIIQSTPGILQTDIYKKFDPPAKEYVSSELYFMAKDGIIKREKAGRTYSLKSIF